MIYRNIYSWLLLFIGMIITAVVTISTYNDIEKEAGSEFLFSCNEIRNKITMRLDAQAQALQSGIGLFSANDTVTRQDWKSFIDQSKFLRSLPGILGVGYAMLVQPRDLPRYLQLIRNEGFNDFNIKPQSTRDTITSIVYLEPLVGRNLRAFGYDMFTEPVRHKAMEQSRDLNLPIITGKVTLVQETSRDIQAGTLMYLPVYRKGYPVNTVEERRKAIKGWVYSPYRMNDMMAGILGNWENKNNIKLNLIVYDGDSVASGAELYRHISEDNQIVSRPHFIQLVSIDFNTTCWTLKFFQPRASLTSVRYARLWLTLFGSIIIVILLFLLFRSLIRTRNNARQIANQLTSELRESETRLRFAIEGSKLGTWDWDIKTGRVVFNEYWATMLGYTPEEIEPYVQTWENMIHPDDKAGVMLALNKHLKGEIDSYQAEYRIRSKSYGWKWILDIGRVTQRNTLGNPLRVVGTHSDITERKQDEELEKIERDLGIKLSKAKNFEETMRICLKAAIVYAEMDGGGIYMADDEEQSLKMIYHKGLSQEFIRDGSFYHTDSSDTALIFKGEPIYLTHEQVIGRDNFTKNPEALKTLAVIPLLHFSKVIGCINIASFSLDKVPFSSRVILERIASYVGSFIIQARQEDKLNQNRQDLNTLFNTIDDFLFILDAGGKVIYYNSIVPGRLGYDKEDILNLPFTSVFSDSKREEISQYINSVPHRPEKKCMIPLICKDGIEIPTETRVIEGVWNGQKALIGISHDITDRKEYEQQLKQNSERLEMALLGSDAGLWDWNVKTDHLVTNEKWCNMRGYKLADMNMNVNTWKNMLHPDDESFVMQELSKHLENKTSFYQAEYRTRTKSGQYIWVLDTGKITEFNDLGQPMRMVGTNIDITSKKESEFRLQQNLKQQELVSEIALELNSPEEFDSRIDLTLAKIGNHVGVSRVYIFEDNNDGSTTSNTFEWCNSGISSQKHELQNIPYEIIPSWKELLMNPGRVYSEDISTLPGDLRAILEPQEIKSIVVYPLFLQGHFLGFIGFDECVRFKNWSKSELELLRTVSGIISNAYERKISEKSLRESEAKSSAVLESIPDILFHFNKQGKILSFRSSSLQDLALPPEKFINKSVSELFPEEFASKVLQAISICLEVGFNRFEYSLPIQGNMMYFDARMAKMNENEVISIARNVTERMEYERQMKEERDKANSANKAKSEFLANMSHEIRTPMNAILGFSEALYHQLELPQHKKMIKSVLNSGNLLLSLLNDILDLSKIEAGRMEIALQPCDFNGILQEIKLLFNDKAQKKGIDIRVAISPGFPNVLMLDEMRIKQVVFNLVGNAIKFTHQGFVEMIASFSGTSGDLGQLTFTVKDTGIGIPESQQQIIFEAFMQQSGQSNRKYGGVGLGLAISKRLVEKMGGVITVVREENKGSSFTVTIPDVAISSSIIRKNEVLTDKPDIIFEKASILIIDDVASNIELIENLLFASDITVTAAENGEMAMEILNRITPDIILLDLRMPGKDGYEVARCIKENPDKKHIPIIAFTASVFSTEKIEGTGNFDGILFKPVSKGELECMLAKFLPYIIRPVSDVPQHNTSDLSSLPDQLRGLLPEIEHVLNEKYLPLWESIKDSLVLFSIEGFANELKKMAENYNFPYLINYSDQLNENIELVDLESLKENLRKFPLLIRNISNMIHP
ncbi:MAG TPA: CHASE domain-containing protein [Bacteroidales bacterium]